MVTNRELGDAIGVSPSMASRLRSGQRLPSVKVLVELAAYLGVGLDGLVAAYSYGAEHFGKFIRDALEEVSS